MALYQRYTGDDTQEAILFDQSRQGVNAQRLAGSHLITIDFGAISNVVTPVPGQLMYDTPTATPMMWDGTKWIPFGGVPSYEIKLTGDDSDQPPDEFIFEIPAPLAGAALVDVRAFVTTVGSSVVEIQINNLTGAVAMLTTDITIDIGELSSRTAAVPPVIASPPNDLVANGDQVQVEVIATGTSAMGHGVILQFV